MEQITFGCSVTNVTTSGNYNYYLYSRVDNYALILREKTDNTEYKFYVISPSEDIDTIWAAATTQTYLRPDEFSVQLKKYITGKMYEFLNANRDIANNWS